MDRGQPGFRAQRKRRLEQAEEGHPALVGPVDHRRSGTSLYEQWELVRIRQIWGQAGGRLSMGSHRGGRLQSIGSQRVRHDGAITLT